MPAIQQLQETNTDHSLRTSPAILFCWTLWKTAGQDRKTPSRPEIFLLPFSLLPPRTPCATTTTPSIQQQLSIQQLTNQHLSNSQTSISATHRPASQQLTPISTPATMGLNHYRKLRTRFNEYIYRDRRAKPFRVEAVREISPWLLSAVPMTPTFTWCRV